MPLRVRVSWGSGAANGGGVSTFNFIGDDLQADANAAAAAVATAMAALEPVMDVDAVWTLETEVDVFNVLTGQTTGVFTVAGATGNGNSVGDKLPLAVQGLVRLRTGFFVGGREVRGRLFIPAVGEPFINADGTPTVAFQTTIADAIDDLRADPNCIYAVYSPTHSTAQEVTAVTAWSNFAVLRSRRD
jgi:hypothetical protein